LQFWLGLWEGTYLNRDAAWVRFFDEDGRVVPTHTEAAMQEVEAERDRAEQAEAEITRLREELGRYRAE
jgi:hypothetical protein